ncbi:MAG: hypothetical protein HZA62_09000 [Rhodocyclales bacterium]|nr:hypothetical protein [Rhodocyclales bacterium]MBI5108873.1 hypothetical protein [Rhodocyclales bacterium]
MKQTIFRGTAVGIVLAALTSTAAAQMNIVVEDTARDAVGGRLAFAIKERIRSSAGFTLAPSREEALIRMSIVTLDDKSGYSTVYSVVFSAWQPESGTWTYLNNIVGTCGSNRITECADGLVADADKASEAPKAYYRDYFKNQGKKY